MSDKEVSNPIAADTYSTAATDDPAQLGAEIEQGIYSISEGKRWLVEVELQRLKDQAQSDPAPEAMHNLLLFRKYAVIAFQIKDENVQLKTQPQGLWGTLLPEAGNDEGLLNGYSALRSNFFWLRVLSAVFSLIASTVMGSAFDVSRNYYKPYQQGGDAYGHCGVYFGGHFATRTFLMVTVVGALVTAHTLGIAAYYLLPVDAEGKKYIPGFRWLVEECLGNEQEAANLLDSGVPAFLYTLFRCVGALVDHCLVVLCAVAFVLAAVNLDTPAEFKLAYSGQTQNWDGSWSTTWLYEKSYYTIPTFFKSFSCLHAKDPTAKIQASLAMLFFATCVQAVRLAVVWRRHRKDVRRAVPADKQHAGAGESGESFLAVPLATSEADEDDGEEEVSVTFTRGNREGSGSATQSPPAQRRWILCEWRIM